MCAVSAPSSAVAMLQKNIKVVPQQDNIFEITSSVAVGSLSDADNAKLALSVALVLGGFVAFYLLSPRGQQVLAREARLMPIVRDLIQTVGIGKTPGHELASLEVHGDIANIMASTEVIDVLQQQFFAAADLRPDFPPVFRRVLGFQSGLMRPVFP